jgi:glycosyltransferase involved in cell wall biosynthesis
MKILVVGLGGVTATFRNWPERILAVALARRGHEVRAIGTHDPQRPALATRHETIEGVSVQRVRSGYWPNRELAAALEAGPRPDVIHFMHPRNVLAAQTTAWARRHGIPTLFTWLGPYHDAYFAPNRERPFDLPPNYGGPIWTRGQLVRRSLTTLNPRTLRDHLRNFRLHWPLKQARHLIPCSDFEAAEMRRMGMTQPQTMVPLWIDLDSIRGQPDQPPSLDAPRPWILFVGQLTPRKGYDLALQALPAILRRHPTAALLMVSGINHAERAEVQRIGDELGIAPHIHFLGRVDDAALVNLFRACDVYVTPTRYEGFGLTLLEAMAAGAPIVASDIPVVKEIIQSGENGLLAAYDDPAALAAATLRLLDDPALRASVRRGGAATVEDQYNETTLIAQIEAAYRSVQR